MVDKEKAIAMRREGYPVVSIARFFGVNIAYIYRILPPETIGHHPEPPKCIYEGLKDWIIERRLSVAQFARLIDRPENGVRLALKGDVNPRKDTIDLILNITGLTYEQCFCIKKAASDCHRNAAHKK